MAFGGLKKIIRKNKGGLKRFTKRVAKVAVKAAVGAAVPIIGSKIAAVSGGLAQKALTHPQRVKNKQLREKRLTTAQKAEIARPGVTLMSSRDTEAPTARPGGSKVKGSKTPQRSATAMPGGARIAGGTPPRIERGVDKGIRELKAGIAREKKADAAAARQRAAAARKAAAAERKRASAAKRAAAAQQRANKRKVKSAAKATGLTGAGAATSRRVRRTAISKGKSVGRRVGTVVKRAAGAGAAGAAALGASAAALGAGIAIGKATVKKMAEDRVRTVEKSTGPIPKKARATLLKQHEDYIRSQGVVSPAKSAPVPGALR